MKYLTIKIEFEDDFKIIPDALMINSKIEGGTITGSARFDLFECFDVAEHGLQRLRSKTLEPLCSYTLDKINGIVDKE